MPDHSALSTTRDKAEPIAAGEDAMDYLQGGRENKIVRSANTVLRPAGFWTPTVHALLRHIRQTGFSGVPEPLGIDANGREIVSFLAGDVVNYPLTEAATSVEALTSAAHLLRAYHDSTVSFLTLDQTGQAWMLPPREPAEVVCHGDFAPYNVVLHGRDAIGIIDFDTAHPAPRTWDIAYALYRWAPLTAPDNHDGFGDLAAQIGRARLFCDAYELSAEARPGLSNTIIERLQTLVTLMQTEASQGNPAFQANMADGHHLIYLADIAYIQHNQDRIDAGLRL